MIRRDFVTSEIITVFFCEVIWILKLIIRVAEEIEYVYPY